MRPGVTVHRRWAMLLAYLRFPLLGLVLVAEIAGPWVRTLPSGVPTGLVALALLFVTARLGTIRAEPIEVDPPVRGRWVVLRGPESRVPSHGIQYYGQTYAIDLVFDPGDRPRPRPSWRPIFRPAVDFPAFGQPVYAPAAGVVVRTHDGERDHHSRISPLAVLYMFTIEQLRELTGPNRVGGNHVILDLGGGVYAALMHLRRDSLRVRPGQPVEAGDLLAEVGNSGNSTEPHLHFQLMTSPNLLRAAGLPFRFAGHVTPRNGQHLECEPTPPPG